MRYLQTLARRAIGLSLAILLAVPAFAAEPSDTALKRQEDLDALYHQVLEAQHPNLFANTPETEFLALKAEIEGRLETERDTEFLLDLMRLTALAGDAHTSISGIGAAAEQLRYYPLSMGLWDGKWHLTTLPALEKDSLGKRVDAINGKSTEEIVEAFAPLLSADNPTILARRFRQYCQIADIYEYLGLAKAETPLTLTLEGGKTLSLEPAPYSALEKAELAYLSDQITRQPTTAQTDAYYFAKPLDASTYYIQYNACMEDEDLPMEDFAAAVAGELNAGAYTRVLLDLRNNGGGSDGVIWPLFEVLRQAMDGGAELVGLIGARTFSSALINAVEIQEMGGVLAGESTGGSVCHFGAVQTFTLPNSGIRGQVSSKYIDLNTLLDAGAGRGVEALEPDISIPQSLPDTLAGKDTVVDWLLNHPEKLEANEYPDAPLTRGRFIGQLYAALGSPAVKAEEPPFPDSFGIEWYLPALTWAKEAGVAKGYLNGDFAAAKPISWREAAVFLNRAAETPGLSAPDPSDGRRGPIPAALASGWEQGAVTSAWDRNLLPDGADFTRGLTRAQGQALAGALAKLLP